jgi:hypothetical protein
LDQKEKNSKIAGKRVLDREKIRGVVGVAVGKIIRVGCDRIVDTSLINSYTFGMARRTADTPRGREKHPYLSYFTLSGALLRVGSDSRRERSCREPSGHGETISDNFGYGFI